jgi:hypothetical protein
VRGGIRGVYFLYDPTGFIKIGHGRVRQRASELQIGNPRPLIIVAIIPYGTREVEGELHDRFSRYRHRGEWFSDHPKIWEYIESLPPEWRFYGPEHISGVLEAAHVP